MKILLSLRTSLYLKKKINVQISRFLNLATPRFVQRSALLSPLLTRLFGFLAKGSHAGLFGLICGKLFEILHLKVGILEPRVDARKM